MWHRRLGTIWWKKTHLQIQIEKSSTNGSDFPLESRICCQKQNLWWQNVAKSLRHPGIQSFPWPEVAWRRGHTQPNDGHQGVPSRCPSPGFGSKLHHLNCTRKAMGNHVSYARASGPKSGRDLGAESVGSLYYLSTIISIKYLFPKYEKGPSVLYPPEVLGHVALAAKHLP